MGLGFYFFHCVFCLEFLYSNDAWCFIVDHMFLVTYIDLGGIILFIGNLSLSADDLSSII